MELKNLNILNVFKNKTINDKSITLLVLTLLPAMFVTKSLEATLIYCLLYVIFIILTSLLNKVVDLIGSSNTRNIVLVLMNVTISILIAQFVSALNINFTNDFILLVYLFPISALPYLVRADNEESNVGKTLVDSLQSVIILIAVLIVSAILREFIGTGGINFGKYIGIKFGFDLFSKYAITIFTESYSALIVTGLYIALLQLFVNNSKEVTA